MTIEYFIILFKIGSNRQNFEENSFNHVGTDTRCREQDLEGLRRGSNLEPAKFAI